MLHNRLKTVYYTIFLCYILILSRIFYWQIIKYNDLFQKTLNQNYKTTIIEPLRGKIFDSGGYPLALNQTYYHLSFYKPDIKTNLNDYFQRIKQSFPQLSEEDTNLIEKFKNHSDIKWTTLKYNFTSFQKQIIDLPGAIFKPIILRNYPENDLAKNIIGNVFIDSNDETKVLGGLESYYQKQLSGKEGFSRENRDATGQTILTKKIWSIEAINGRNIHTSINRQIQFLTDEILKNKIDEYGADSGSIIIIKPETGSIIAMSSYEASSSASSSAIRIRAIADLYEPGSIFKPLVVTMALDNSSINTNFICERCNEPRDINQYSISNWDNSVHPKSTLQDIIKNSDNIGMSYVIDTLGRNNFFKYFQLLGFNRKTDIDLKGETKPLNKEYWSDIDFATASFGQGFAVTEIQMLQAFNTIANDGYLVKPHLVEYFSDETNHYINKASNYRTRIFKMESTREIKSILKYAVENGVVAKLKPANLEVCAKSGTAQIAVKGGYSDSSTIASYIGFSPCNQAKFSMIVTIKNPKSSPWGSSTAGPIWFELASKISPLI